MVPFTAICCNGWRSAGEANETDRELRKSTLQEVCVRESREYFDLLGVHCCLCPPWRDLFSLFVLVTIVLVTKDRK